jgi:transcriptional regulator with XRE-family HTH domain
MTSTAKPSQPAQSDTYDDFDDFLNEQAQDPAFAAAYEDAAQRARLVKDLVSCRKAQKIKQREIACHMEIGQSVVSEFENSSTDAYFSTLQRYARAVGARLAVKIEMPADQSWASHVRLNYAQKTVARAETTEVRRPKSTWIQDWASEVEHREKSAA